jgi:hypothetical protein
MFEQKHLIPTLLGLALGLYLFRATQIMIHAVQQYREGKAPAVIYTFPIPLVAFAMLVTALAWPFLREPED